MREGGVPSTRLWALGLGAEHQRQSYGDVLRALPDELGVQLEFWRSAPGEPCWARQAAASVRRGAACAQCLLQRPLAS